MRPFEGREPLVYRIVFRFFVDANHMPTPLSPAQITAELYALGGWQYENQTLRKTFQFAGFREAMAAVVRIAFEAEAFGHHPEIHLVWDRLTLTLCTHEAGNQVTDLDVVLALRIEAVLS